MGINGFKRQYTSSLASVVKITFFLALWALSIPAAHIRAQDAKVVTSKQSYKPGEAIEVRYSGAPGLYKDWICVVEANAPDNEGGDYDYIKTGIHKGVMIFDGKPPGDYEVRAYYDYSSKGYQVAARHSFTVASIDWPKMPKWPAVRTSKTLYAPSEPILVFYTGAQGKKNDWISVVRADTADTEAGDYKYVPVSASRGILTFGGKPAGSYEVRAYYNYNKVGYKPLARYKFKVGDSRSQ